VKLLRTIRLDASDLFFFDMQQLVGRCDWEQIHRHLKAHNLVVGLPIRQVEAVN
jgi:hypothetical protein